MPSHRHHDFGNMYVQFNVKFPEKNWTQDAAAFDALRQILPAPSVSVAPPATAVLEPVDVEDTDAHSRGFANDGDAMDEDEDGHPGGERVQCASQ